MLTYHTNNLKNLIIPSNNNKTLLAKFHRIKEDGIRVSIANSLKH